MIVVIIFILLFASWYIWKNRTDDFMETDPVIVHLKNKLLPVFPELSRIKLMKGNSSYTINKYRVYICTEYKGKKYDTNMLTYVILHELAHVLTPEIGHGQDFVITFNNLLERGTRYGLYNPNLPRIENYCKEG